MFFQRFLVESRFYVNSYCKLTEKNVLQIDLYNFRFVYPTKVVKDLERNSKRWTLFFFREVSLYQIEQ
jgi:hypothetical protein